MRTLRAHLLRCLLSISLVGAWGGLGLAHAHDGGPPLRLGVFAYLGIGQTTAEYAPLVQYLNSVQHHQIELRVLPLDELTRAVELGEVDLLTTNPTHFILVRHQFPLSGVIATRQFRQEDGSLVGQLGGVIVVRSDREDLHDPLDLVGMRIATPTRENMGGYRAQVYELMKAGVRIESRAKSIITTQSHQRAIGALLTGDADVAFVRTGILERMIETGELDSTAVRVLLPKQYPGFKQQVSTALYPEWPFLALPHVDPHAVHSIAAALYGIENLPETQRDSSLRYSFPGDYSTVEELARAMRLPPYDAPLNITLLDVWKAYWALILAGLFAMAVIMILYFRLRIARNKIRDALAFKESTLDSLGEGLYESDERGIITYMNPAACSILGFTEQEVLGQDAHTLFHYKHPDGSVLARADCPIHRAIESKSYDVLENWFVHKRGAMIPVRVVVSPLRYRDRIRGYVTAFLDLTHQKAVEERLAHQNERLGLILEGTQAGTWEWHIPSGEILVSEIWYQLLGHTRESLGTVSPERWEALLHPDDRDHTLKTLTNYLKGEIPVYDVVFRMAHREREWVWIQAKGKVIQRDTSGTPILMAGTHQDVTVSKVTEVNLRETNLRLREAIEYAHVMAEKAEQASAAKSRFLGRMSHEMRTPMNGVIGMASVLKETPLSEDQRSMVDVIHHSGESMLHLVDKILAYTQVQSGTIVFEPVLFKPLALVEEVVARVRPQALEKGLDLTIDSNLDADFSCVSDAQRIEQVLTHLLSNAVRFTSKGGITLRVEIEDSDAQQLRIEVRDTGEGIPEKDLPHLFDHFMQGDESLTRTYGGAGLGLAISREILLALQGNIGVNTLPGVGSTFWFTLPIQPQEIAPQDRALNVAPVVVVDPNAQNRKHITESLSKAGTLPIAVSALSLGLLKVRTIQRSQQSVTAFLLHHDGVQQAPAELIQEMHDFLQRSNIPLILYPRVVGSPIDTRLQELAHHHPHLLRIVESLP